MEELEFRLKEVENIDNEEVENGIKRCEMMLDSMEEELYNLSGELFEEYKNVVEEYMDLIKSKFFDDGFIAGGKFFGKMKNS